MPQSRNPKDVDPLKLWLLPEFGLINQAHNMTQKKLKAKSNVNTKANLEKYENSHTDGFNKGYNAGLAQAANEMNKRLATLTSLTHELSLYKNNLDQNFKNEVYQFITMLCEKILLEKFKTSSDTIMNIVNRGLEVIDNNSSSLKIFCNDNLLQILNQQKEISENKKIVLEKDDKLLDYAFRIESDKQFLKFDLHASVAQLIDESKDAFMGSITKK